MTTDFYKLASQRRSIRKFTKEPLTPEQVETILKAGLMSPSSKNAKPWHFIIVEDKQQLDKLSLCKKNSSKFIADCSLAIIVAADPLISDVWIEDSSIASIMMQLQAEALGLGSCWVQIRERYTENNIPSDIFIREIIDIPIQIQILSIIAFGNKLEEKPSFDEKNLKWEHVHIDKF